MYLYDFQKIGGIFIPGQVIDASTRHVEMQGELHLYNQVFHIKIKAKRNCLVRITKVCGTSAEEAYIAKEKLKKIWYNALDGKSSLTEVVNKRKQRIIQWMGLLFMYAVCFLFSMWRILTCGISIAFVVSMILSVVLFLFCIFFRDRMLKESLINDIDTQYF